jgi:GAF domain-containing protein
LIWSTAAALADASEAYVGRRELAVLLRSVDEPDALGIEFGVKQGDAIPLSVTHCQRMLDGRIGSTVSDLAEHPETRDLDVSQRMGLRAYAGVPVRLSSGEIYGTLCAVDTCPHPGLGDNHTELLGFLSSAQACRSQHEVGRRAGERRR